MGTVASARPAPTAPRSPRVLLRDRATTTPGRLVLIAILVVIGAAAFGVIATLAERSRGHASAAARYQTEPLLVHAVTLSTALSAANATATTTFLTGGLEPPQLRERYNDDLRAASDALARLSAEVTNSPQARAAITTIAQNLPVYSGYVESARANNLQGFPVGAAYLRRASSLLDTTILPAADHLYEVEATRLHDNYGTGASAWALAVIIVLALIAVALLVWTQLYLTRISRRVFNIPLLLATLSLAAVTIWAIVGMVNEQNALAAARRDSDAVEVASATRVLLSRAQSDESLILVNRGSDDTDPRDLALVTDKLSSRGGLLDELSALAKRGETPTIADKLRTAFSAYRAENARITALQNKGRTAAAISEATSPGANAINHALATNLAIEIGQAQSRFTTAADSATSTLSGLSLAIPLFAVLVAALALLGLRQRLEEYR